MLKLFSQLPLGVSFSDIFGGGRQWKKVDANDAIDVEGEASERKSFDQFDICSIGPSMQADFLAMQAQMNAVRGAPNAIDADDDFVDMARALREGRLYALDPHDPSREFSFVVAAHDIHPQHVDASAWVVDALGRKEPASCPMPVGVWRSEFSDLVFVPEADALIKALYDEQGAFARNDAMGERVMEKVSLDENTQMRRLLADLADYAENATLEGDEPPSSVNDARALLSAPSEKSRVAACLLFNEELLEQYEVLGDIAYQYNVRTLTDIMHLQTAILEGTHIDAWVEQSSVLDVLAGLPSGQAWISTYTSEFVNDECVRDAAVLKQQTGLKQEVGVIELAAALRESAEAVKYLRPERFDDAAHETEFDQRLKGWMQLADGVAYPGANTERSLHFGSSAGFSVVPSTTNAGAKRALNTFQVTEGDVVNVLESNEMTSNAKAFLRRDGESMQSMAREIFRELDFDAIEQATQKFAFRDEQIEHGCAEIERQLRCKGTLKPLQMRGVDDSPSP